MSEATSILEYSTNYHKGAKHSEARTTTHDHKGAKHAHTINQLSIV